jgi:tRNA threonylcarbamoyl adenosine modification protein YeaZ
MLILAVDTSLPVLSVALYEDGLIGAVALEGRESRNQKLLPAVDWLLSESGMDRGDLKMLAATRGPGSFTGVRVGLATVQGLSFALGLPVLAMSTHEAAAEPWREADVVLYSDAGRGEFYVSAFRRDVEVLAPALKSGSELEELRRQFEHAVDLLEMNQHSNLALLVAQRAKRLAAAQATERYADLTPIYVRLAEAEMKLRRP